MTGPLRPDVRRTALQLAIAGAPEGPRVLSMADRVRALKATLWTDPPRDRAAFGLLVELELGTSLAAGESFEAREVRHAFQRQAARIRVWTVARAINALELVVDPYRDAHHLACNPGDDYCCSPLDPDPHGPDGALVRRRELARVIELELELARARVADEDLGEVLA